MGIHPLTFSRRRRSSRRNAGFTLVEIMIVIIILGILAAIVVPQFVSAADEARHNSTKMDLNRIRVQLEIYSQQHGGTYPTLAEFEAQMTLPTNAAGVTAPLGTPGFPFGPYLMEFPNNPLAGTKTIGSGAPGTSAWYYNETTGEFRANDSVLSRTY